MRLLLDSHVFLWAVAEPGKLSARAGAALAVGGRSQLFVSLASLWELAIKEVAGQLRLDRSVVGMVADGAAVVVPITLARVEATGRLPPLCGGTRSIGCWSRRPSRRATCWSRRTP